MTAGLTSADMRTENIWLVWWAGLEATSALRDDRVLPGGACADGRPRRDRGRSPSGARVTHADWGRGHLQRDARALTVHIKRALAQKRWVRVHLVLGVAALSFAFTGPGYLYRCGCLEIT